MSLPEEARLAIDELTRLLLDEETLETTLRRVVDAAVHVAANADAASVSLERSGKRVTFAASDDRAVRVDRYQYEADEGPCIDALRSGDVVRASFPKDEYRWPAFSTQAAPMNLRGTYAMPLRVRQVVLGALNVYSFGKALEPSDEHGSTALGAQAAIAVANAQIFARTRAIVDDLNSALDSRDVIGQAKGILMERHRVTSDDAFKMLVDVSQQVNEKLRDVASVLTETGELPTAAPPRRQGE